MISADQRTVINWLIEQSRRSSPIKALAQLENDCNNGSLNVMVESNYKRMSPGQQFEVIQAFGASGLH